MKTMMVVGVFAIFAFSPVNVKETVATPVPEPIEEVCVEEEGLVCTIRDAEGQLRGRCWFCDCAAFAKQIDQD